MLKKFGLNKARELKKNLVSSGVPENLFPKASREYSPWLQELVDGMLFNCKESPRIGGERKLQILRWGAAYYFQFFRELWFWR